ncbi:hypothetical protein WCLP8_5580002 [uncultured Gammaproteobacteria bacterium]
MVYWALRTFSQWVLTPPSRFSNCSRSTSERVERLYCLFVGHVAKARGLDEVQVRDQQAGLYFGADAVAAGLADQVGTSTSVLADLNVRIGRTSRTPVLTPRPKGTTMTEMSTTPQAAPPSGEAEVREQLAAELTAQTGGGSGAASSEDREALTARLRAEAAEILELCQIAGQPALAAGQPALAAGFVRQGLSPSAVRKTLLKDAADQFEAAATVPVSTQAPAGDSPLIAAIKASYRKEFDP